VKQVTKANCVSKISHETKKQSQPETDKIDNQLKYISTLSQNTHDAITSKNTVGF